MDLWKDRDWTPSEEEVADVGDLRTLHSGQVLLRLIDQTQELEMWTCGFLAPSASAEMSLAEVARIQGSYQALQRVKDWLLQERVSETESQEIDNG